MSVKMVCVILPPSLVNGSRCKCIKYLAKLYGPDLEEVLIYTLVLAAKVGEVDFVISELIKHYNRHLVKFPLGARGKILSSSNGKDCRYNPTIEFIFRLQGSIIARVAESLAA